MTHPAEAFLKPTILELPSLLKLEVSDKGTLEKVDIDMMVQGMPMPIFTATPASQNGININVTAPSNASDQSLTWTIDKPDVASIVDDGTLTALSPGTAVITVESNANPAKSDTLTVTVVNADTVSVSEVNLTPATIPDSDLTKGDSFILSYVKLCPNIRRFDGHLLAI